LKRKIDKKAILDLLEKEYKGTKTALNYETPFELLIAVILSAQCTDVRVNFVTKRLFPKYNTPQKLGAVPQEELENMIHECGFFRSKSKNILKTCKLLLTEYNGIVPDNIKELMTLPGVGKKTANVIVNIVYGVPAIAVDTHVFRVSKRLGLAKGKDVVEVEKELMKAIPKSKWGEAHHWLIWHGRKVCKARKPLCSECVLNEVCTFSEKML
jgi:endonuclease-3